MTAVFRYVAFDNSWSVDLGQQAIRLGTIGGLTELAELGAVGTSDIIIDDPDGTVGHSSDAILALQQFFVDDTPGRVYAGWTGQRQYRRGEAPRISLITGAARQIMVHLEDPNTLAGRLAFPPSNVDATVKRPSETAAARITWLLGTAYFPGVADHGLVHPATITLDANDYSGQHPADVLNDCCVANGDNWFVRWNRGAAAYELCVYNATTYTGDTGTLRLSNDLGFIDSTVTGGAGATNTWAVEPDALLTRDPSTYCDRVLLPYAKSTAYRTTTSTSFPDVTHSAPSTSVKTLAAANAQADRFLADNADEADRITCSAQIAVSNVNDALAGQLIYANFTHLPGYATPQQFRISRRTVSQADLTDQFYTVQYELVPAAPLTPTYSYAELQVGASTDYSGGSPNVMQFQTTGDAFCSGWGHVPLVGLIAYDQTGAQTAFKTCFGGTSKFYTGLKVTGGGTVDVGCNFVQWALVWTGSGRSIDINICQNGAPIKTVTQADGGSGTHFFGGHVAISALGVSCVAGDIFTITLTWSGVALSGETSGAVDNPLYVTGYLT